MTHNRAVFLEATRLQLDEIPLDDLEVKKDCSRCFPSGRSGEIQLLSPNGVVHESSDFGYAFCGVDATGEAWWWRI